MALSQIYVDPSIGTDTGLGTLVDPFGNIEYGIVQTTFDVTNGTLINVRDKGLNTIVADLIVSFNDTSVAAAWVPSVTAPIIIRGYSHASRDGGRGKISGGNLVSIADSNAAQGNVNFGFLHFIDMDLFDVGANRVVYLNDHCGLLRCDVWGSTTGSGTYLVQLDNYSTIHTSRIRTAGAAGGAYYVDSGTLVAFNRLDGRGGTANTLCYNYTSTVAYRNIIICEPDRNSNGLTLINGSYGIQNSIWCSGGSTGAGLLLSQNTQGAPCIGNIVEGFNGVGGRGIAVDNYIRSTHGNAVFDCTTPYDLTGIDEFVVFGDNEILTASAFTDAANGDFSPVVIGNVREGHVPFEYLL